jgi:predicted RNase H-like HicB family nuclease
MASYIGLLRKEAGSDYGVEFPDFPGCVTAGADLDEARRMAADALAFHIEGMIEDGATIPEPSSLEAVMADPDIAGAVAVLIDGPAPAPAAKVVRINITMEDRILYRIDAVSRNRSRFLSEAAAEKLARMTEAA